MSVYGNKGSTDQHAYVQQLRDGVNNFFVTFIRVLESTHPGWQTRSSRASPRADYLQGFLLGTREALYQNDRESMTLTVRRVDSRTIVALIALFERAVGFYASLVGVNAYHQPGVEAGKQAATAAIDLQQRLVAALDDTPQTAAELARWAGDLEAAETAYALLEHLAADGRVRAADVTDPGQATFRRN